MRARLLCAGSMDGRSKRLNGESDEHTGQNSGRTRVRHELLLLGIRVYGF